MEIKNIINYLEDENIEFSKKYNFLENLNLNYSTLFYLMDYFRGTKIHEILSVFVSYNDPTLKNKIRRYYRENNLKNKTLIRRKFYDKY